MAWFPWRRGAGTPPPPTDPPKDGEDGEDNEGSDAAAEDELEDDSHLDGVEIYLAVEQVQMLAQASEPPDIALLQARLADLLRDEGITPPSPLHFAAWSKEFGDLAWRQVALSVEMLAAVGFGQKGAQKGAEGRTAALSDPYAALMAQVQGSPSVGIELLATSEVRAEEFIRRLAAGMGIPIEGETPKQSRLELEKLDYSALLAMANDARLSAEERMARLRALQASQDSARRRGKW